MKKAITQAVYAGHQNLKCRLISSSTILYHTFYILLWLYANHQDAAPLLAQSIHGDVNATSSSSRHLVVVGVLISLIGQGSPQGNSPLLRHQPGQKASIAACSSSLRYLRGGAGSGVRPVSLVFVPPGVVKNAHYSSPRRSGPGPAPSA